MAACREWFLVSFACMPFFVLWYFDASSWVWYAIGGGVGLLAAGGALAATRDNKYEAPLWSLGTPWPIGAAVLACLGFFISALWIDTLAAELVRFSCRPLSLFQVASCPSQTSLVSF